MPKRGDLEFVSDIREAIERIERYTKGITYKTFLKDTLIHDAVIRNLEIIGEAAKSVSAGFKKKNKNVEWKNIIGMRDKLIHHYFGVNWEIVWNVLKEKLPTLKSQVEEMLKARRNKATRY